MARELTAKQRRFIEEYVGPANFNATAAAKRAGYSEKTARQMGSENLAKPYIAAAIETRLDELSMSAAEVTKRFTDWARADPSDVVEILPHGGFRLDLERAAETGAIRLIKELSYDANGMPKVKFHDAKDAAIQVAKIRGLYVGRVKHEGSVDVGVLMVPDTDAEEWDDLAKRRQAALSKNGDGGA